MEQFTKEVGLKLGKTIISSKIQVKSFSISCHNKEIFYRSLYFFSRKHVFTHLEAFKMNFGKKTHKYRGWGGASHSRVLRQNLIIIQAMNKQLCFKSTLQKYIVQQIYIIVMFYKTNILGTQRTFDGFLFLYFHHSYGIG